MTTYMYAWPYTDQYMIILPNTLQDTMVAMLIMFFIALLLIPNLKCLIWIVFTMVGIAIGVIGYMTWWGVHLDAVSMMTVEIRY